MKIILLSGGSGKRLWPLSNNTRSKQFIRLLPTSDGQRESMVQRVVRQLKESNIEGSITVATSVSQKDVILNQLGEAASIVTEPERRDTFPAIALACSYLAYEKQSSSDEVVVVMPSDPYTEQGYFSVIEKMSECVRNHVADLVLMGIQPTYASEKFGYIVPNPQKSQEDYFFVERFTEKPNVQKAQELMKLGALWNGGVFAFRLGYMLDIIAKYTQAHSFQEIRSKYSDFPKISFDYEVVEKAESVAVVPFAGQWRDLGTWNSLTEELKDKTIGNVYIDQESKNTHVINELGLPIMCVGGENLVIAASNDGILVSDKSKSETIKTYADQLQGRPMFEEMSWGEYRILNIIALPNGEKTITKEVTILKGKTLQQIEPSLECKVMTVVSGEGNLTINGECKPLKRGDVFQINIADQYIFKAISSIIMIVVQSEKSSRIS